ncbi:MAG: Shedu anti-phage system protein SduA domain-containing protein [Candidatus Acidiferrum sp.]
MNILLTELGLATLEAQACVTDWRAHHHIVERMPMERIIGYLRLDRASSLALVDAIVCMADSAWIALAEDDDNRLPRMDSPLEKALALAQDVRNLPDNCTMRDGRKWKKIPIAIFTTENTSATWLARTRSHHASVFPVAHPADALHRVQALVDDYHERVLQDYQNLGMLVSVAKGRAQIGPALQLKKDESDFYYARGDRRNHKGLVTVKRDREGLHADVELFAELLDRGASERQMHKFFEEHPAILMEAWLGIPISHRPQFDRPKDDTADYSFSPILGPWDDKTIKLLEMKGPAEKAFLKGRHAGFAAMVHRAVDQVRDYGRYLGDPANITPIVKGLGYLPDESKLAVLIGREPKSDAEQEAWAQRQSELDVRVVTYDEILAKQVAHLHDSHPYRLIYGIEGFPLAPAALRRRTIKRR